MGGKGKKKNNTEKLFNKGKYMCVLHLFIFIIEKRVINGVFMEFQVNHLGFILKGRGLSVVFVCTCNKLWYAHFNVHKKIRQTLQRVPTKYAFLIPRRHRHHHHHQQQPHPQSSHGNHLLIRVLKHQYHLYLENV